MEQGKLREGAIKQSTNQMKSVQMKAFLGTTGTIKNNLITSKKRWARITDPFLSHLFRCGWLNNLKNTTTQGCFEYLCSSY